MEFKKLSNETILKLDKLNTKIIHLGYDLKHRKISVRLGKAFFMSYKNEYNNIISSIDTKFIQTSIFDNDNDKNDNLLQNLSSMEKSIELSFSDVEDIINKKTGLF